MEHALFHPYCRYIGTLPACHVARLSGLDRGVTLLRPAIARPGGTWGRRAGIWRECAVWRADVEKRGDTREGNDGTPHPTRCARIFMQFQGSVTAIFMRYLAKTLILLWRIYNIIMLMRHRARAPGYPPLRSRIVTVRALNPNPGVVVRYTRGSEVVDAFSTSVLKNQKK